MGTAAKYILMGQRSTDLKKSPGSNGNESGHRQTHYINYA